MDDQLAGELASLDPSDSQYATRFVERLLAAGRQRGASDLHLQPRGNQVEVRFRIDGVLVPIGIFPNGTATSIVARLKVLAGLLTYRTDVPQEGRIRTDDPGAEVRVSTFPTLDGEPAVVRLFGGNLLYHDLAELGTPKRSPRPLAPLARRDESARS